MEYPAIKRSTEEVFPKRNGDLRLLVYDLLKQNNSIQRNIQPTYIEDVESRTLQRYFMLSFTYTIRQYTSKAPGITPIFREIAAMVNGGITLTPVIGV